ncbi:MAG: XRE family transcriptional regulator [Nitrospinales bacterium]
MNGKSENFSNPGMGKRVREIRGDINQETFGGVIGTSQGNVSKIEKGSVPEANILLRIARHGKTTVEFLLTGRASSRASIVSHNEKNLPSGISLIKKVKGSGSAGPGLAVDDEVDVQLAFRDDWLSRFGGPEKLFAMYIEGDSMEPALRDKDIVVVDKNIRNVSPGGGIYSLNWQGKRMVKRLQLNPKTKTVVIKSDNPNYGDLEARLRDIKVEGKLIWYGREMK